MKRPKITTNKNAKTLFILHKSLIIIVIKYYTFRIYDRKKKIVSKIYNLFSKDYDYKTLYAFNRNLIAAPTHVL